MVTTYVPEAGDIVFIDFDPQVGHEQANLLRFHRCHPKGSIGCNYIPEDLRQAAT